MPWYCERCGAQGDLYEDMLLHSEECRGMHPLVLSALVVASCLGLWFLFSLFT